MFTILLHSSKTMRQPSGAHSRTLQLPALTAQAEELATYLKTLSPSQLKQAMGLSDEMAEKTHTLIAGWNANGPAIPAIDAFLGDIYSGLQVQKFTHEDREYANGHLFILSGLYGVLRALDEVQPYRLEMGYKLPNIQSMYAFWGDKIARQLPKDQPVVNLSAVEYTKAVFPYFKEVDGLKNALIVTPKFLTISPKTGEPVFVTVHAKVARGAFARWLIQNRVESTDQLREFKEIGYSYMPKLSTESEPVFVARMFRGIGLSVRLTGKG